MERDPLANDVRKAIRKRRLPPNAICACGENRPEALDVHHVAGRANAPDLVIVRCRNCHAIDTEAQRDAGVDLSHASDRTTFEHVVAALRSIAEFLVTLGQQLGDMVDKLVQALDQVAPGWRQLPAGQP